MWTYWNEVSEGPQRWRRNWGIHTQRIWESWGCSFLEDEAQGDFFSAYQYLMWVRKGEPDSPSGALWQDKRQWAQMELQEIPSEHKLFSVSTGTDCPERLWGLHPWRYSKPDWTWSWASCSSWPCLNRRVGLGDYQRSLHTSTVLWVCCLCWLPVVFKWLSKWNWPFTKGKQKSVLLPMVIIHYQVSGSIFWMCFFGLFCKFPPFSEDFLFPL